MRPGLVIYELIPFCHCKYSKECLFLIVCREILFFIQCVTDDCQTRWLGTTDAEVKMPSAETPELLVLLSVLLGIGQNIALHASSVARNFYFPVHSNSSSPFSSSDVDHNTHTYTHKRARTHTHLRTLTHTHTEDIHARTRTHTHTRHTNTHTHIHTHR